VSINLCGYGRVPSPKEGTKESAGRNPNRVWGKSQPKIPVEFNSFALFRILLSNDAPAIAPELRLGDKHDGDYRGRLPHLARSIS
jgi:hypothetical protein